MTEAFAFIAVAIIIEGLVSYIREIFLDREIHWQIILAILIGCLLSFNLKLDIFQLLNITEQNMIVGYILTGILMSRGSNYFYELISKIAGKKVAEEIKE